MLTHAMGLVVAPSGEMSRVHIFSSVILLAGCYPTLPPQLAEGTEVLRPGGVSLNFAGGGAAFATNVSPSMGTSTTTIAAGGLESRVRVGVGGNQEVGASLFLGVGSAYGGGAPPFALGGKLSYKIAPVPWLALVVDAGALGEGSATVAILAGDLAVIVAPYTARNGSQLYVAARGSFGVPFLAGARDVNESFEVPIGFALHTSKRVRFFIEGGPVLGFAQQVVDAAPNVSQDVTSAGAYGVIGVTFVLR
jgi:hypothetical protein